MSGWISRARTTASSPLSTVTMRTSSLAKLIPTTFWIVTLSSARSRVLGMFSPGPIAPGGGRRPRALARPGLLSSPRRGSLTPFCGTIARGREASGRSARRLAHAVAVKSRAARGRCACRGGAPAALEPAMILQDGGAAATSACGVGETKTASPSSPSSASTWWRTAWAGTAPARWRARSRRRPWSRRCAELEGARP